MPETKRMSLDTFLEDQSKARFIATVEGDKSNPDVVIVTPWVDGKGCLCRLAIKVRKGAIEGVAPTGQSHHCCNKVLKVVEVHFKKGETISLNELFDQLYESASSGHSHDDEQSPRRDFQSAQRFFPPQWQHFQSERGFFPSDHQDFRAGLGFSSPSQPLWFSPWDAWKAYKMEKCRNNLRNCQANCAFEDYPFTCNCLCENSFKTCTGVGELVPCPNNL